MRAHRKLKPIPSFKSEAEEREFWETHDTADYVNWEQARIMTLPNLKASSKSPSPHPRKKA